MTNTPANTTAGDPQTIGMNRRSFIGRGLALTGASMFSSLITMQQLAGVAAAQQGDDGYKALVCLFMFGGNDGYNTLVPTHPGELADYQTSRGTLALQLADTDARRGPYLPLQLAANSPNAMREDGDTRSFAVHPAMGEIQQLFDAGSLAFVANAGNLSEPISKAEYQAVANGQSSKLVPKALFSHNDQQSQWRNAEPNMAVPEGWAGRFPDELSDQNLGAIPMRISLNGNTNWLANQGEGTYVISESGSRSLFGDDDTNPRSPERIRFEAQVGGDLVAIPANLTFDATPQRNVFKQFYNQQVRRTVDLHGEFSSQFAPALAQLETGLSDPMEDNGLELKLKAIAATVAASQGLQMKRQVFFVGLGGFDTHSKQLTDHNELLGVISRAMNKFWDALGVIDAQQDVVTFTASEFGRTLRRNGSGTDHAWGSHHWVLGGPVDGGKIFGQYPEQLTLGGPLDIESNGRMLPTTSIDEYGGELARWFGVPATDMSAVFPNADLFYDTATTPNPIGFLAQAQPQADQVSVVQSCFGTPSRGRFDISVTNNSDVAQTYSVKLSGLTPRDVQVAPGSTGIVTITARRDGTYNVAVTRGAEAEPFFVQGDLEVDCFVPVPWVLASSCLSGRGRFDLWIENETASDALFEVSYSRGVGPEIKRVRSIPAGEIFLETITGRPYGTWVVAVTNLSTGQKVFSETADVLCGLPNVEAVIRHSCMTGALPGFRGRIDVDVWNNSPSTTRTYQVTVTRTSAPFIGEQVRTATLAPDGRSKLTITGRPNLPHQVRVTDVTGDGNRAVSDTQIDFDC